MIVGAYDESEGTWVNSRFDDGADFPQPKAVPVDVKALAAEMSKNYIKQPAKPSKRITAIRARLHK